MHKPIAINIIQIDWGFIKVPNINYSLTDTWTDAQMHNKTHSVVFTDSTIVPH